MKRFGEVIGRVEEVRKKLGLNKSQFSRQIGMKPQTYNNFVGSQGSKPNIELIYGIVREFNVNPMWLLDGRGETFQGEAFVRSDPATMGIPRMGYAWDEPTTGQYNTRLEGLSALREELDVLLKPFRNNATPLLKRTPRPNPHISHATQVLNHYFFVAPEETAAHVLHVLEDFRLIAEDMEKVHARKSMLGR